MLLSCHTAIVAFAAVAILTSSVAANKLAPPCDIETDVVIIGGGAAGTYAAISLLDKGVDVILIEQQPDLGGHADTYTDPATGTDLNVGVQILHDNAIVRAFASRLGVPLFPPPADNSSALSIDFTTGKAQPDPEQDPGIPEALATYINILNTTYPYLNQGFFLPHPVPEDLAIPFGEFATKHNITAIVFLLNRFTQGWDIVNVPTLYVFMIVNLDLIADIAAGTFLTATDINDLYRSALSILGKRIFLNTHVKSVQRSSSSILVRVAQAGKSPKTIKTKKLLMTGSPVLPNFLGWDLSPDEKSIFSKFSGFGYFAGVVSNPAFPNNTIHNVEATTEFHTPALPAIFVINNTPLDHIRTIYYGTPQGNRIDNSTAARMALDDIDKLVESAGFGDTKTELLAWFPHGPFNIEVSAGDILDGFYAKLYALQGVRNTFWSGSTWSAQDSATIWAYTENVVLPMIILSLDK